jgi:hypothetical protein
MSARELGNPFGNPLALAKKAGGAKTINPTIVDFVNGVSGDYVIPDGYSFFRVTVVGGGASGYGSTTRAGGGGGLARTAILPVKKGLTISYIAAGIADANPGNQNGSSSQAIFDSRTLIATGGATGSTVVGAGGIGSGGDYNFQGGPGSAGTAAGGGGAAGPTSNGGAGNQAYSGDGGGGGANSGGDDGIGAGGGGVYAPGGANVSRSRAGTNYYWGSPGSDTLNSTLGSGGAWGGGAGCPGPNNAGTANGGYGGVRIELW